jgi:hypothetical protein
LGTETNNQGIKIEDEEILDNQSSLSSIQKEEDHDGNDFEESIQGEEDDEGC